MPESAPLPFPSGLSACDIPASGSLSVSLVSSLPSVATGASMAFTATVSNAGPTPLADATAYVKIFRRAGSSPLLVDWFPVAAHLALGAGKSIPLSFDWNAPPDSPSGDYVAALYIVEAGRFDAYNALANNVSFSGALSFSVVGGPADSLRFDDTNLSLAGVANDVSRSHVLTIANASSSALSIPLVNASGVPYTGAVVWRLYAANGPYPQALVASSSSNVEAGTGATALLSYPLTQISRGSYYLLAEAVQAKGAKAYLGLRIINPAVQEPALVYAGISAFPPEAGKTVAEACVIGLPSASADDSLEVSVQSAGFPDNIIASSLGSGTYRGSFQNLAALKIPFISTADSFDLTARLYRGSTLLDEVTIPYRCAALGAACHSTGASGYYLAAAGLLVLAGFLWWYSRHRAKNPAQPGTPRV